MDSSTLDSGQDAALDTGNEDVGPPLGGGCSSDLQSILSFEGSPIFDCAPAQGCADGQCVSPCDAAAASGGTLGCRFLAPTPSMWEAINAPCFAIFVANAWPGPAALSLRRGTETFDVSTFGRMPREGLEPADWPAVPADGLPADEVAVLFLTSDPGSVATMGEPLACPVTPAVSSSTELLSPGTDDTWQLSSDVPVAAYDIYPFGGARSFVPSASLLLPVATWGTEYIALAPPVGTHTPPGPMWIRIVADEVATVQLRPTVELIGGSGLPTIAAGGTQTIVLNAGEHAFWQAGDADFTGTIVSADVPVAVFVGNRFLRLQPTPHPGGESNHQQSLPLRALASEYVLAPFPSRRSDSMPETIGYRLLVS